MFKIEELLRKLWHIWIVLLFLVIIQIRGISSFKKEKEQYLKFKVGYPIVGEQKDYILKHIKMELAWCDVAMGTWGWCSKYIQALENYQEKINNYEILDEIEIVGLKKFIRNIKYPIIPVLIEIK